MSIQDRTKRIVGLGAAALGVTLGAAAFAGAATSPTQQLSPTTAAPAQDQGDTQDPALNGSIQTPADESVSEGDEAKALEGLAKISAAEAEKAALDAVPGGTVNGSALENENGSVVYAVDVTDATGAKVEVKVDAGNGTVLAQEAGDEHEGDDANEGPEANEASETSEASQATSVG